MSKCKIQQSDAPIQVLNPAHTLCCRRRQLRVVVSQLSDEAGGHGQRKDQLLRWRQAEFRTACIRCANINPLGHCQVTCRACTPLDYNAEKEGADIF